MAFIDIFSTNQDSAVTGEASATIGSDITASLDVSTDTLIAQTTTNPHSEAQASIGKSLTATVNVAVDSLYAVEPTTNPHSEAQASIGKTLTAALGVVVDSLYAVEATTNPHSESQATIGADLTLSLDVAKDSLYAIEPTTNPHSESQATIGGDLTLSAQVNVAILGLVASEDSALNGAAEATIGADVTASLQINVSIFGAVSTEDSALNGYALATIGADVSASLDVLCDSLLSVNNTTNPHSEAQATIGANITASMDVAKDSLYAVEPTTNPHSEAQATIGQSLTASLDVSKDTLLAIEGTTNPHSEAQPNIGKLMPISLDVSKDTLLAIEGTTNPHSEAQATIGKSLTAGMDVAKDSLYAIDQRTNPHSESQATIGADLTLSMDVAKDSLYALDQRTNPHSESQATIGDDLPVSLDVLVAVLGVVSTEDSELNGYAGATLFTPVTAREDGFVTGSGNLIRSELFEVPLDITIARTYTVSPAGGMSLTIQGTETVSTSLEMLIAAITDVDTNLEVQVLGTETVDTNLDLLKQTTAELTPSLQPVIAATYPRTAGLDMIVKATFFLKPDIDVHPSPERRFLLDINAVIQGVFEKTVDMSLLVQTVELLPIALDMLIEVRRPYSLLKLWGHTSTRFFGGTDSDANFFEHFLPHPSAVINADLGTFSQSDREVTYQTPNTIPTPAAYDKYSLPLAVTRSVGVVGFRVLACLTLRYFGPNNTLLLGVFTGTNDPVTDLANGDFCGMAIEAEKGHVEFRAWAGGSDSSRAYGTGLPLERFLNVPLLLEIETVSATAGLTDMQFRLFDRSFNLDRPLALIELQTSVPPDVTHFAITSLGRRTPELPTAQQNMHVDLEYVDVEYGGGAVYAPEVIPPDDAKLRCFQDRPPLILSNEGTFLVTDELTVDQGYWRLDTGTPSTLSFPGAYALLTGGVFAEPTGSASWSSYQAQVEVRPGAAVVGTDGATVAIYSSGTSTTGDGYLLTISYILNTWYVGKLVGGVSTVLASAVYTFGTFDPFEWHTLRLNGHTDASGQTLLHAFVDGNPLVQIVDSDVLQGTVALSTGISFPVAFRNLVARQGVNDVFALLSDSPSSAQFTDTRYDTITADASDPIITVVTFTTDSPIIVPGSVNPQIVKGSLNPGFSGVAMSWYATHAGTWTLRVNSTGATTGIELRSGTYPEPFALTSTGWDFSELPQVDDVYDVTLYLITESGKPTAKRLGEYLLP